MKKSYCLKLEEELWQEIDRNRMLTAGVLNAGISKVDYIRDAIIAYNEYFRKQVEPRVKKAHQSLDAPMSMYFSDGLDIRW